MPAKASEASKMEEKEPREDLISKLSAVETVPVLTLLPADSPRSDGEDLDHVRLLSESDTALPPVIVHRPTMRVVDGMHRLRAAVLRGQETIQVQYFDGDERDAFLLAVKANVAHGLPLSARDRAAAVARILRSHPHLSDRAIAEIAGLSARTVRNVRRDALPGDDQPSERLGRDGRVRPLDSSAGRIRAAALLAREPQTSLREIAQKAGISPSTVRDVRDRLRRGEDPLPSSLRSSGAVPGAGDREWPDSPAATHPDTPGRQALARARHDRDRPSPLSTLIGDPSLRSGERGRQLLRILSVGASLAPSRDELMEAIPEHCVGLVCEVAKESAAAWTEFAERLERRSERCRV
ncbi:cell cycle transcriptional regulator TrcR [Microbispora sp. ZYX-F-249]|uniref:Cell cycle transcriptional regulator TrcR n=1 Tax=Microbispora maris TaxID=3144104 RepID=A0ABV0AN89_9ACTN